MTTVFLKVHGPPMTVGQPPLVQQLQQRVEHLGVGLFDLVEEDHAVGPPPHRLGELAALLVAHVAGRGADEARDGVALLVLAHVDADHGPLVVKQELGQRPGQLGLAHAGRPQEDKAADGPVWILQPSPAAAHRVGHDA